MFFSREIHQPKIVFFSSKSVRLLVKRNTTETFLPFSLYSLNNRVRIWLVYAKKKKGKSRTGGRRANSLVCNNHFFLKVFVAFHWELERKKVYILRSLASFVRVVSPFSTVTNKHANVN
mmetsp:Transcript_9541/g.9663  ORF Transcript_9541/g.9663 Transcript_9541/m.9663 type:complete len:119 (+) Transcript_9541:253-609(+)